MKRTILIILLALVGVTACNEESPYSGYSVFFTCDITFSPFNQATALGEFITVKRKNSTSYEVTDVFGTTHTRQLTEIEARQQYYYGLGGLIIGTPSLQDGTIWAYDWACPNCDAARHRLQLDDVGHASCPNCGAVFDLNIGGIPIEGDSRTMWRYRTMLSGSTLVVQN